MSKLDYSDMVASDHGNTHNYEIGPSAYHLKEAARGASNDDRLRELVAAKLHKLMGCLAEEREKWLFHQLLIRCDRCKEIVPIERATLLVDGPKYGMTVHPSHVSETLEITLDEYTAVLCEACRRVTGPTSKVEGPEGA